jgi:hypothetical protein
MQDGRIGLNTTDFAYTSSDNTAVVAGGIAANKVFVNGSVQLIGANDAIVFGRGTGSFMKDEELGFGWGGGWHMTDATFLRSRNNKHVYNEAPYSGSSFRNFASSYDAPNLFMTHPTDTNWTFGASSNNSNTYWMQVKYSGNNDNLRGFRVLDVASGIARMSVADKITTHQNTFYRTWQGYTGSDNNPMKTWDGVLAAGSDSSGAQAYTVIQTNIPQDAYMMGGFSIEWFENYQNTNGKTSITLSGYWNPVANGNFVGFEYTSSNPNITPTIQVGRNTATGRSVIILSHFNSNHAIVVARDLWLGYSGGDYDYGAGWSILQTASLAAYSNLVSVVARVAQPAGSGSGSGLNADLLDGIDSTGFVFNGTTTNGSININGGTANASNDATVYITATNNNDWGLIVNKYNASATEYGIDLRMGAAATYAFRIQGNGADKLRINGEGHVFAPIYYDSNNNAYYGDFASTSNINALQTAGQVVIGGTFGATAHSNLTAARLMFSGGDADAQGNYYIGTNAENYGGNYNKLDLRWHTGIRMGAQPSYGGIRFYSDEDFTTQVFAINKDGAYAQANQSMRAPIFYDLDNTSYYIDPTSITSLRTVGSWRADSSTWDGEFSGKIQYHSNSWYVQAADSFLYRNSSGSNVFTVNQSGVAIASNDMRAPIFYDSNNTGFYVDPASTTNLNILNVATLNISGTIPTNTSYLPRLSDRDFADGTLVQTNINYAVTSGDPFVLEITGNSYGQLVPWDIQIQGYIYSDTIINTAGISNGTNITGIRAINYNGNLCFWWPRQSYWNGFTVYVYVPYATFQPNRVTSISNSTQPTTTKQVIFTVYQNYSNYNSSSFDATFNRLYSNTDVRAQLFYDYNDTSYYVDPHSTSYQRSLFLGAHDSGTSEFRFGEDSSGWYGDRWYWDSSYTTYRYSRYAGTDSLIHYHDTRDTTRITYGRNIVFDNYGKGIVGTYASTRYQGVFAMGDSYKLPADGTSAGNLYGLAWSYPSAGGVAGNLNTHGLLVLENGGFLAAVSGSIRARDDMRAPIFYDSNNTSYYVDPSSTGLSLSSNGIVSSGTGIAGGFQNRTYTSGRNRIWSFGNADGYGLSYFQGGPDYIGLHPSGTATQAGSDFWVSSTGIGQASGSLRAPIFYDSNNTGFYVDPASTSNLNTLNVATLNISGGTVVTSSRYRWSTGYFNDGTTTAAFVADLSQNGHLSQGFTAHKVPWDYAGNSDVNTGIESIEMAGCAVSTWHDGSYYTSLVIRPTTGAGGGGVYIYNDQSSGYSPGWRQVWTSSTTNYNYADIRSPLFYDVNNTGYYVDPASTSNLNAVRMVGSLTINNSSPTIYLQDTDHNVSMIHCNSNIFYVLRGSTNSTSWATTNGYWPLEINLTNNDALFGRNLTAVGEVTAYSDIRLKKDVETISDALTKVMSLRGVTYYRKDMDDDKRHIGVIAQEIQEVLPEVVSESKDNNDETVSTLSVSYGNITAVLIEAIKEQQKIIEEQGKRISALENLINKSNNT